MVAVRIDRLRLECSDLGFGGTGLVEDSEMVATLAHEETESYKPLAPGDLNTVFSMAYDQIDRAESSIAKVFLFLLHLNRSSLEAELKF